MSHPLPIFDGHNDVLLRLHRKEKPAAERLFLDGEEDGQLDLPRAFRGGFAGGMFAVFVPSVEDINNIDDLMRGERYDVPLPSTIAAERAITPALAMAALLYRIERASEGKLKVCRTAADIRRCLAEGAVAAVLHIEGAEPIDPQFRSLEVLYQAGLRSLGPVWSRPNIFGHGVPFRFPSAPDIGPGLTDLGKELVKACNQLKITIDLSHLNEQGFWDVARLSDAPLIATHSNAHAVCPHARNLTDKQLAAIRERGGMVGVNFATCFIRPDGQINIQTGLDQLMRHVDHLVEHLGIEGVGFGSDFDGAKIPASIGDVAGLDSLREALEAHGFGPDEMRKLCHENWINVLERTWGE
jgi:membrane dipeptidase